MILLLTLIYTQLPLDQTLQTVLNRITKQLKIGLETASTPFLNPIFGFWISNTASRDRTNSVRKALDCRARGRHLDYE